MTWISGWILVEHRLYIVQISPTHPCQDFRTVAMSLPQGSSVEHFLWKKSTNGATCLSWATFESTVNLSLISDISTAFRTKITFAFSVSNFYKFWRQIRISWNWFKKQIWFVSISWKVLTTKTETVSCLKNFSSFRNRINFGSSLQFKNVNVHICSWACFILTQWRNSMKSIVPLPHSFLSASIFSSCFSFISDTQAELTVWNNTGTSWAEPPWNHGYWLAHWLLIFLH